MIHSQTCQHALRALIYLAGHERQGPVLVRRIAEATDVPRQTLSKILHGLSGKGLVRSRKGPGGGFELARPGSDLTLMDVIVAVDGPIDLARSCVLGLASCSDDAPCAMHDYWKLFREQYFSTIAVMSLEDAAKTVERKQRELAGGM